MLKLLSLRKQEILQISFIHFTDLSKFSKKRQQNQTIEITKFSINSVFRHRKMAAGDSTSMNRSPSSDQEQLEETVQMVNEVKMVRQILLC